MVVVSLSLFTKPIYSLNLTKHQILITVFQFIAEPNKRPNNRFSWGVFRCTYGYKGCYSIITRSNSTYLCIRTLFCNIITYWRFQPEISQVIAQNFQSTPFASTMEDLISSHLIRNCSPKWSFRGILLSESSFWRIIFNKWWNCFLKWRLHYFLNHKSSKRSTNRDCTPWKIR